jgi:hypothetical protein
MAEPVPANSRASSEAIAPVFPKIRPCGATTRKNPGSTIQTGVPRKTAPMNSTTLPTATSESPTRAT